MAGEPASALHDVKRVLSKIFRCARKNRSRREASSDFVSAENYAAAADPSANAISTSAPIQPPNQPATVALVDHNSQSAPKIDVLFDTDKDKDSKAGDEHPWLAAVDSPQETVVASTSEGSASKSQHTNVPTDPTPPSSAAKPDVPKEPSEAAAIKPDDSQSAAQPKSSDKILDECPLPPIKSVHLAPGMSATSGPLEDFPEEGEMDD